MTTKPDDVTCPRCKAPPGIPCTTPGGWYLTHYSNRAHHVARKTAALVDAEESCSVGIVTTQAVSARGKRPRQRRITVSVPRHWPEVLQWTYRANRHGADLEIILTAVREVTPGR